MTCNTSAVAVCCSNASRVPATRRAFSIAMAACPAKQFLSRRPAPVFAAILEEAPTLCDAAYGRLLVRDGEEFRFAAAHGEPGLVDAASQLGPMRPAECGLFALP